MTPMSAAEEEEFLNPKFQSRWGCGRIALIGIILLVGMGYLLLFYGGRGGSRNGGGGSGGGGSGGDSDGFSGTIVDKKAKERPYNRYSMERFDYYLVVEDASGKRTDRPCSEWQWHDYVVGRYVHKAPGALEPVECPEIDENSIILYRGPLAEKLAQSPSLESSNWERRKLAVELLTDQKQLEKVASEELNGRVREAAVKKITDQDTLLKIARSDKNVLVREAAAKRIKDPAALAGLAAGARDGYVRNVAVKQIKDEPTLAQVAISGEPGALHKITDPALLAKVAVEGKTYGIRESAVVLVMKSGDQAALAEVALHSEDEHVRGMAVWKLTDQEALAKLALEDKAYRIRRDAVGRVTDETVLAQVAAEDEEQAIRDAAMALISQPATREQIRQQRKARSYRQEAGVGARFRNVTQELARAAEAEKKNESAGRKAELRTMDGAQLAKAASTAADPAMRLAAAVRAGQISWAEVVSEAERDRSYIGLAICGLALDERQDALASRIAVLCREYLFDLDPQRVPELKELLKLYGTPALAQAYRGSEYPGLKQAALLWNQQSDPRRLPQGD